MQIVWRPTCPTIHEIKQFHFSDVSLPDNLKNIMSVFSKVLYYRGFCWLYMRNSLADDVNFILIEFRMHNSIQTENIQLAHLGL